MDQLSVVRTTSKLAGLRPSFSELSYPSQLELILSIRANRRIPKRFGGAARATKPKLTKNSKRAPTKADARSLLAAMTPEMAAALIASLGATDD